MTEQAADVIGKLWSPFQAGMRELLVIATRYSLHDHGWKSVSSLAHHLAIDFTLEQDYY